MFIGSILIAGLCLGSAFFIHRAESKPVVKPVIATMASTETPWLRKPTAKPANREHEAIERRLAEWNARKAREKELAKHHSWHFPRQGGCI